MNHLVIKNSGIIDPRALHLVGASSKGGDASKIGQFGSGNKYAIAYLLRNGYEMRVFSGTEELQITTNPVDFRGHTFEVICIAGVETSITTDMGKDWELWQALRELYCNALDEGDAEIGVTSRVEPRENETHFYIEAKPPVFEFMAHFDDYFSMNKKALFECEEGQILQKSGNGGNVYRKGIRCYNPGKPSLYDYNFNEIEIDENRLVKYPWQVEEKIWNLIYRCTVTEVIATVMMGSTDMLEGAIADYSSVGADEVSQEFRDYIKSVRLAPRGYAGLLNPDELHNFIIIPTKIFSALRPIIGDDNVGLAFRVSQNGQIMRELVMTSLYQATLKGAVDFFNEVGFVVPYAIRCACFEKPDIFGAAVKDTIWISDKCFEAGVTEVVNTIIEEFIHLKYGVSDCTRKFQTAVISEFITYMKVKNAYTL